MYIEKVVEVTEEIFEAVKSLVPQLGAHKAPPTWDELNALVNEVQLKPEVLRLI